MCGCGLNANTSLTVWTLHKLRKLRKMDTAKTYQPSADEQSQLTVATAYTQAIDHFNAENYLETDRLCSAIIKADPNHIKAINLLGITAQKINRHDLAIEQFQSALNIDSNIAMLHYNMGVSLLQLDRREEAVQNIKIAQEKDPDNSQFSNFLDDIKKLPISHSMAANNKSKAEKTLYKGISFHQSGQLDEAIQWYRKTLAISPKNTIALSNMGFALQSKGRVAEAIASYQQAIAIQPNFADAHRNLGSALKTQGKLDAAVESYQKAISIQPDYAEAYCNLALALQDQGKLNEAVVCYQKAISMQPDSPATYYNIANILKEQGKLETAVSNYKKAIAIKPDYFEAYNNLGMTLEDQDRLDEAVISYQKVISIKPDSAEAYNNLGNTLKELGKTAEAIASFQKAILIKPNLSDAYYNLGILFEELNMSTEASGYFRQAVQFYPNFPETLAILGNTLNDWEKPEEIIIQTSQRLQTKPASIGTDFKPETRLPKTDGAHSATNVHYCLETVLQEFAREKDRTANNNDLRIVLLQPPLWKNPAVGQKPYPSSEGGQPIQGKMTTTGDTIITTYGLLSIAAQILKSGRKVLVCNLATSTWPDVEKLIRHINIDLVGITCMTFNLRGVKALSTLIRDVHPKSHIVVGGPHPTALPAEMLNHFQAIDTVVIGEGELTFLDMVAQLEAKKPVHGIAGTAWRDNNRIQFGNTRERIKDLDSLAAPHEYFSLRILQTSRGCAFQCTFCAAETVWKRKLTKHSVEYILRLLEKIVIKDGVKYISIKDETFTASRRRTLEICHGIIERKLNFFWSCDTRANNLDDELLKAMQQAGCQRISLGVESGSPAILNKIKKNLIPEKVVEVSKIARKYGIQVRAYMIAGNQGESLETFQQSVQLLCDAQVSEFNFSTLMLLPGTQEFEIYRQNNDISTDVFFDNQYYLGKYGFSDYVSGATESIINYWIKCFNNGYNYFSVDESLAMLETLDGHHTAHMNLAGAYLRAGQPEQAEPHVNIAIEKGYPMPELSFNYLACIAGLRGDIEAMELFFKHAETFYLNPIIRENSRRFQEWVKLNGVDNNLKLRLIVHNNFPQVIGELTQPFSPAAIKLP